jgi:cytochrome c-type biogenesis protein CcmF
MTLLGQFALWSAFLLGVWGAVIAFSGRWQDRPDLAATVTRSVYAVFGCLVVASLALWKGLITHDFNIEYVAAYTSRNLPPYFVVSAFWAGQKGSLLFWAVVLSLFASLAQLLTPRRYSALMPYVAAVTSTVIVFFVSVMLFGSNPFERLPYTPADGRGLNPQLQNVGMVIHPPMLYLGYISITIPFAFAVAALLSRRLDVGWIQAIRKWTLVSWLFLSIGITLGMWWAYVELGWGGYWAWDPVENASFLPWLTMTAFLHSVMIQEKRGMLKRWNLGLIIGTFLLSIFGTFITRSGVIASVHSFTQSNVGYFFLAFLTLAAILSFTLLYTRWPALQADVQLESMLSREAAFLFNNLLLVGIAFSVLWGTLFPILSEAVRGTKITVGPPFFNRVNVPLGLLLLGLTGIGPLIAWRKASTANLRRQFVAPVASGVVALVALLAAGVRDGYAVMAMALAAFVAGTVVQEFYRGVRARRRMHGESVPVALFRLIERNRRRYGGYIVHVGVLIYFVAFAGMAFKVQREATLKPGDSVELRSPFGHTYKFTHVGISQYEALNRVVSAATVQVEVDGHPAGLLTSEKRQHVDSFKRPTFEPSTEVGIRSGLREDLYLVFAGAVNGTEEAVYRFNINPLVWWVWFGGFVLAFGGIITMWPGGGPVISRSRPEQSGYGVTLVGAATGTGSGAGAGTGTNE